MTGLVVVVALLAGAASTEWLLRTFAVSSPFWKRWHSSRASLQEFQRATDDDARQKYITKAGLDVIGASLSFLWRLVVFGLIFGLPMLALAWDGDEPTVYLVAGSVAAIAWWLIRRRARPSS